jgi:hypothetical protein
MNLRRRQPPPPIAEVTLLLDRSGAPLPLRQQPAYVAKLAEIAVAEEVRDRARRREERARVRALNPAPSRGAVERMKDLAAGGFIPAAPPANERQAAVEEAGIARAAEIELNGELAEIASELSHQYSKRVVSQNRAAMIALYEALAQAAAALSAVVALRVKMFAEGYQPNESALPSFIPPVAYQIGPPDDQNSQCAALRRWLSEQGWI